MLGAWLFVTTTIAAAAPFVPSSDEEVLEQLPYLPGDPAMRELRELRQELVRRPDDLTLALRVARGYTELGRVTGDPRYTGYAQAALMPWWASPAPPPQVLLLRATLRQRVHEFAPALADLSTLIKLDPRNGQARLTRATVLQVQGEFAAAAADCALLRRLADELVWATCTYGVAGAMGRLHESYEALSSALGRSTRAPPEIRAWALGSLAEMAARDGNAAMAEAHFREALALDPEDHYLLGAYADFLLDEGRHAQARRLLDGRLRTDALLLRYALALKAANAPDLSVYVEQLRVRFDASRLRGDRVHLREEARFALYLGGNAQASLRLAQDNWSVQKELPDLRILLEAAHAANDRAAFDAARGWLAQNRMEDVHVRRLAPEQ